MPSTKLLYRLILTIPFFTYSALAADAPAGPLYAVQRLGAARSTAAQLAPAAVQANMALDVFEHACLAGVMHAGDIDKWAVEHRLEPIDGAIVAPLLRTAPTKAWIMKGANGRESDLILAELPSAKCIVMMIRADVALGAKGFLDLMEYQKAHGVTLERFPDQDVETGKGMRRVLTFASVPKNEKYALLWGLEYTTADNAVALRFRSEFVRQ